MKKSDAQLQQDVLQELKYEPSINAAEIGVSAKDGIVGLTGNVQSLSRSMRRCTPPKESRGSRLSRTN
jgi:osmotically-inducible protein OsmY